MIKYTNKDYDIDTLNKRVINDPLGLIDKCEKFYISQISDVCDCIISENKTVVLLSGPSASGKTTTSGKICEELNRRGKAAVVVSLDDFYLDRDQLPIIDGNRNAEVVEALDLCKVKKVMKEIVSRTEIQLPYYDFKKGIRIDNFRKIPVEENMVVIFEGIHALNEAIRENIAERYRFGVYVSPHSGFKKDDRFIMTKRDVRFVRRCVRDSWARGTSPEETFAMWTAVCEGEDKYIRPCVAVADMHINTTHAYEPGLIAKKAVSMLETVSPGSEFYERSVGIISELENFVRIPTEFLPGNSLLREFVN